MPIIKSAIKRARQADKRRSRNLHVKREIHRDLRAFEVAVAAAKPAEVTEKLQAAVSEIDRAVKKNVLHKNTAARRKSQLQKAANAIIKPEKSKAAPKKPVAKAPAAKAKPATKAAAKKPASKSAKKA